MDTLNLVQLLGEKLMIELPPVGLTFTLEQPKDVPVLHRDPQSFCTLWRWAEERVFYASGEQHMECGLGGLVSGFLAPEGREDEVAALLDEMCEGGAGTAYEIAQTAIDWLERRERDIAVRAGTEIIHLSASMIWRHSVRPRPADGDR